MTKISKLHVSVTPKPRKTPVTPKCHAEGAVAVTLPFSTELGKRLVSIRGRVTQKEFARSIGIHKNTLIRYERGERLPDAWVIMQLRELHEVNPLWLLSGIGGQLDKGVPAFDPDKHPGLIMIPELLAATMQAVDAAIAGREPSVTSEEKTDLVLAVYSLVNTAVKKEDVEQLARLKAEDIRGAVDLIIKLRRMRTNTEKSND